MNRRSVVQPWILGMAWVLAGCFDGSGSSTPDMPDPPANAPPSAHAGNDQVVAPGAMVSLDGTTSTDANGTIAAYAWTQTGGAAVTLASAGTATPSFTAPTEPGALTFRLTVTDNGGASHSDTVTVTVNAIPVANAGADQSVSAGAAVSLAGSATDADGSIAKSVVLMYSSMCRPARRPNTTRSTSELVPSRLAPCTETQADSPAE